MNLKRGIAATFFMGGTILATAAANADEILDYTGNNFTTVSGPYTTNDKVTVTIMLSSPLAANLTQGAVVPLSYSFNDGLQTFPNSNVPFANDVDFWTDASGNITEWSLSEGDVDGNFITTLFVNGLSFDGGHQVLPGDVSVEGSILSNTPGSWSVEGVPEPSTWAMVLAGLFGVGFMVRCVRRKDVVATV